jgi:tape measure domain-containing protein
MAGIRIELELEDGTFTTRMLHAGESVDSFNSKIGQLATGMARAEPAHRNMIGHLRDVIVVIAAARLAIDNIRAVTTGWAYDILKVNGEFERLTVLLKGMSTAANPMKEATEQVKQLRDYAKEAPFQLKALTDTFVKLKSTGIDPMAGGMKSLVDSVASFGGSEEALHRVTIAVQQMAGKGVIQMEELRQQLGEHIPRAVELMARSVGVSTAQLIQAISKGTLDAKKTLEVFFIELDRTFGGSALAQMQTFNGMLSQTKTLLQNLALDTGNAGFFDEAKKQLKDFNNFLSSNAATVLAQSLGQAMTTVIQYIRGAIDWLVEFKNELGRIATILIGGFGLRLAMSMLLGFGATVSGVITSVRLLRMEWGVAQTAFATNSIAVAVGQLGIAGMGISSLTGLVRGLGISLGLLGMGLSIISSIALPIAAVLALAVAMGAFDDKLKDAYEDAVKYGATTDEQIKKSAAYVKSLEDRADALERVRKVEGQQQGFVTVGDTAISVGVNQSQLDKANEDAQAARDNQTKIEAAYQKKKIADAVKTEMDALNETILVRAKGFDEVTKAETEAFTKEALALQGQHRDISVIQAAYQTSRRAALLKSHQDEYDDLQNALGKSTALVDAGYRTPEVDKALSAEIVKKQIVLQETMARLQNIPLGLQTVGKPEDLQKALDKAKGMIDKLGSSIASHKAELQGLDGDYAKTIFMLEEAQKKKLSPFDNAEIQKNIQQIKELQKANDELQAEVTGQSKFDREIERIREKAASELLEQQTRGKSDLDKLAIAASLGSFSGLKPIARLAQANEQINSSAKAAAASMNDALGDNMQNKGKGLLGVLESVAAVWGRIKKGADDAKDAGPTTGASTYQNSGVSARATYDGGAYTGNVIRRESGGNTNATNGNAVGLGQFMEATWLEFLRKAHPDVQGSDTQKLSLRTDATLGAEAINWYAKQNALSLAKGGVEVNDSNLYLAHFLGPGGAIAALTKSSDTLLSSIPKLDAARASNPGVFRDLNTVGDLKSFSQSIMGGGMTAPIFNGDPKMMDSLLQFAKNPAQQAAIREAFANFQKAAALKFSNDNNDTIIKMKADATAADESVDALDKHVQKMKAEIIAGKRGLSLDPNDDQYKALLESADALDKADEARHQKALLRQQLESNAKGKAAQENALRLKEEEVAERFEDERKFKMPRELNRKTAALDKEDEINKKGAAAGIITPDELARRDSENADLKRREKDVEVSDLISVEMKKTDAIKKSLMTQEEARKFTYDLEIAHLEQLRDATSTNADQRAQIEYVLNEKIRVMRQKLAIDSPMGKQMKDWADIGNNLEKGFANFTSNATDQLATFVTTGKADFKGLVDSALKDVARLAIRGAIGQMGMGAKTGGGAAKGGGMGKGQFGPPMPVPAGGGGAKVMHAGGVVGSFGPSRMVNPAIFANAHRFHNGGWPGLDASEVPIIAKKGEIVGWPDQMAAKFGGAGGGVAQSNTFHVNVQGSAGTPDQNNDLVEKINKSLEARVNGMVAAGIRQQMRPGGLSGR